MSRAASAAGMDEVEVGVEVEEVARVMRWTNTWPPWVWMSWRRVGVSVSRVGVGNVAAEEEVAAAGLDIA